MSHLRALLAPVLVLLIALLLVSGCGSDDDASSTSAKERRAADADEHGEDDRATHAGDDDEEDDDEDAEEPADPTPVPEPVPAGEQPPIVVTAPQPFTNLFRSFILDGTAQVHEGDLRWAILDAELKPMAQGATTASCGAPCRGRFRIRIPLTRVAVGSWELHVWQPPVADDDPARVHDTMVPITVTAEPVTNAPPQGTVPPGGPPQG